MKYFHQKLPHTTQIHTKNTFMFHGINHQWPEVKTNAVQPCGCVTVGARCWDQW